MKTLAKLTILLFTITLISCNGNYNVIGGIEGSGNVVREKRNLEASFTKIKASTGIQLLLEQNSPSKVEVEVDDNLMKYIITKVENGTLIVKIDGNINSMKSVIVRVVMPNIESLETSSGSSIKAVEKISGNTMVMKTSSGSSIEGEIEYEKVSCESTSGSKIKVSGKALALDTKSSSGSEIDAKDLAANEITAQSTSGSSTIINPILLLNAKASSGSSINFVKEPKKVVKEESSGGSISKN